jgi:hypothetical protein
MLPPGACQLEFSRGAIAAATEGLRNAAAC